VVVFSYFPHNHYDNFLVPLCVGRYKAKFGFPFVICARENKKAAILSGVAQRLQNDIVTEVATGIGEVKKISFFRLCNIINTGESKL